MTNPVGNIIHKCFREKDKPLNILTAPTHERQNSLLAKTGHNFYLIRTANTKDWNPTYAPLPANCFLLEKSVGNIINIPPHLDYDLILSQNKFGQFQLFKQIADKFHIPLLSLEHTAPPPQWSKEQLAQFTNMKGYVNAFITETSRKAWGFEKDGVVMPHGIDTEMFAPRQKKSHALTVANEYKTRDPFLGYPIFAEVTKEIPVRLVGDNPGMSLPAGPEQLSQEYGEALVFFNTSQISPIPMSLLEAMSAGCICISSNTCEIPNIITHGVNGYLYDTIDQAKALLKEVLSYPKEHASVGARARNTILKQFSIEVFVKNWDDLIRKCADITYVGGSK